MLVLFDSGDLMLVQITKNLIMKNSFDQNILNLKSSTGPEFINMNFRSSPNNKGPITTSLCVHQSPCVCGDAICDGSVNVSGSVFIAFESTPLDLEECGDENCIGGSTRINAARNYCSISISNYPCDRFGGGTPVH